MKHFSDSPESLLSLARSLEKAYLNNSISKHSPSNKHPLFLQALPIECCFVKISTPHPHCKSDIQDIDEEFWLARLIKQVNYVVCVLIWTQYDWYTEHANAVITFWTLIVRVLEFQFRLSLINVKCFITLRCLCWKKK